MLAFVRLAPHPASHQREEGPSREAFDPFLFLSLSLSLTRIILHPSLSLSLSLSPRVWGSIWPGFRPSPRDLFVLHSAVCGLHLTSASDARVRAVAHHQPSTAAQQPLSHLPSLHPFRTARTSAECNSGTRRRSTATSAPSLAALLHRLSRCCRSAVVASSSLCCCSLPQSLLHRALCMRRRIWTRGGRRGDVQRGEASLGLLLGVV